VAGHVFISYCRDDQAYAAALAGHLVSHGLSVWYDHSIVPGEAWTDVIEARITDCALFAVVMSDAAKQSRWVQKESLFAEGLGKPVVPLLLSGKQWFVLNNLHYLDVRDREMPDAAVFTRIIRDSDSGTPAVAVPPVVTAETASHDDNGPDEAIYRVDQIRRTLEVRRFGTGYDPMQVDRLFEAILKAMVGRGPMPVPVSSPVAPVARCACSRQAR
jgi:hypothetical protein